jgi:hypothetical protein
MPCQSRRGPDSATQYRYSGSVGKHDPPKPPQDPKGDGTIPPEADPGKHARDNDNQDNDNQDDDTTK